MIIIKLELIKLFLKVMFLLELDCFIKLEFYFRHISNKNFIKRDKKIEI